MNTIPKKGSLQSVIVLNEMELRSSYENDLLPTIVYEPMFILRIQKKKNNDLNLLLGGKVLRKVAHCLHYYTLRDKGSTFPCSRGGTLIFCNFNMYLSAGNVALVFL